MPGRLSTWFRQKLAKLKGKDKGKSKPLIPFPRPMVSTGPLFQKLPPEIRRQILKEAFGNQIIHMDLIYERPLVARPQCAQAKSRDSTRTCHGCKHRLPHASIHLASSPLRRLVRDETLPKQWTWRTSVCHRNPPNGHSPRQRLIEPAQDECRIGSSTCCDLWPGDSPGKCRVGVMGWLLSCRQAYLEGIDVLFSTNTINMAHRKTIMDVRRLFLPERLALIRSVELIWGFDPFFPPHGPNDAGLTLHTLPDFHRFLNAVPSMFPNLRSLYISMWGRMIPPDVDASVDLIDLASAPILKAVDSMVHQLAPGVRDVTIAIPSSWYEPHRDRAYMRHNHVERVNYGQQERVWRPLREAEHRRSLNESEHRTGYWLCLGQIDTNGGDLGCDGTCGVPFPVALAASLASSARDINSRTALIRVSIIAPAPLLPGQQSKSAIITQYIRSETVTNAVSNWRLDKYYLIHEADNAGANSSDVSQSGDTQVPSQAANSDSTAKLHVKDDAKR
ncbi:hypothetical protein G7046_g4279 [Stylonectria norvegica]|nr:hypothetical protein G7046_g4279 [Stylonectria norvegica]